MDFKRDQYYYKEGQNLVQIRSNLGEFVMWDKDGKFIYPDSPNNKKYYVAGFFAKDGDFDSWELVSRDSEEAVKFLGPILSCEGCTTTIPLSNHGTCTTCNWSNKDSQYKIDCPKCQEVSYYYKHNQWPLHYVYCGRFYEEFYK